MWGIFLYISFSHSDLKSEIHMQGYQKKVLKEAFFVLFLTKKSPE